ncbi:MAG: acyl-CoA dehydrogenase family protein [Solirubrobacteraceae bacterium]|nr:acyl-CoA dehydrogenase family protein [Patulibacter sp.]
MNFDHSPQTTELIARFEQFFTDEIEPVEEPMLREMLAKNPADRWVQPPQMEELKAKAKALGLWNLFLPDPHHGAGLSNVDYAPLAERMGRSIIAPEVCNCNAPDTGNMEVIHMFGTDEQKATYLEPLLAGEIRSAFCMTEPDVASSDATNMQATATVEGDEVVINGRKWWSTGIGHPNCEVLLFMGLTDPEADRHHRHSMVLIPKNAPGVKVERLLPTLGFYDEPGGHGEVTFTDVRLPSSAFIGGPGQAFVIAQARLGPGRVHHCMRLIGLAEMALDLAIKRGMSRTAFGKPIINLGGNRERIADARIAIDQTRLLVLQAAWLLDEKRPEALAAVSAIKVAAPRMACDVIDMAIQLHGGAGMSDDFPLAAAYAAARSLRLADGPDEVHQGVLARLELAKYGAGKWSGR